MRGLIGNTPVETAKRSLYIETYGCAMNLADSEVMASIMQAEGFTTTDDPLKADVVFLNTCAIRDNAEAKIWGRLKEMKGNKRKNPGMIVGLMGCMAERLKSKLLEQDQLVDIVVGPDAYRDIPKLIQQVEEGQRAVNVLLSREETYAEITPVRLSSNGVNAFVSIMRGCDNMCSFCVVPFTRGRERSREPESIVREATELFNQGYKEVTLLGQNVDSYKWQNEAGETLCNFAQLLEKVALISPELRVRFSSSHPKDITDEVLFTIKKYDNICNYIHYPVQSGNSRVLKMMNRTYDRAWLETRLARIREILPDVGISTDAIVGFCSETEEEFQETLALLDRVQFDAVYAFAYSPRPGTRAAKMVDDVPVSVKKDRLNRLLQHQLQVAEGSYARRVGKKMEILVEGESKNQKMAKENEKVWMGRTSCNCVVNFASNSPRNFLGKWVQVKIAGSTRMTLQGILDPSEEGALS